MYVVVAYPANKAIHGYAAHKPRTAGPVINARQQNVSSGSGCPEQRVTMVSQPETANNAVPAMAPAGPANARKKKYAGTTLSKLDTADAVRVANNDGPPNQMPNACSTAGPMKSHRPLSPRMKWVPNCPPCSSSTCDTPSRGG